MCPTKLDRGARQRRALQTTSSYHPGRPLDKWDRDGCDARQWTNWNLQFATAVNNRDNSKPQVRVSATIPHSSVPAQSHSHVFRLPKEALHVSRVAVMKKWKKLCTQGFGNNLKHSSFMEPEGLWIAIKNVGNWMETMLKNNRAVKYIHFLCYYFLIYPCTFMACIRLHIFRLETTSVPYLYWFTTSY